MERLVSEPHTRLRYFCSPQHTDSAHYPVIGQMERAADDTPQTKLDKLDAVLADTVDGKADFPLRTQTSGLSRSRSSSFSSRSGPLFHWAPWERSTVGEVMSVGQVLHIGRSRASVP